MKFPIATFLLLGYPTMIIAAATPVAADFSPSAICGNLGVLTLKDYRLPKGVSPDQIRMCAEHPNGNVRILDPAKGASLAPEIIQEASAANTSAIPSVFPVNERACYNAAPYGCSRGYCWKTCGDRIKGEWCWTAYAGGYGAWRTCTRYQDCGETGWDFGCGVGCSSCGCSC